MGKTGVLGAFEELVLLTVARLGDNAYAVSVRRDLAKRTRTEVAMGAVYATLDRLEDKGLIRPQQQAEAERVDGPGRPRRYLEITRIGIRALTKTHSIRDKVWEGIDLTDVGPERAGT